jgi:hypothetical protein
MGKTKNVRRNKSRGKGRKRNMKGGMNLNQIISLVMGGVSLMSKADFKNVIENSGVSLEKQSEINSKFQFDTSPEICEKMSKTCAPVNSKPVLVISPEIWGEMTQGGNTEPIVIGTQSAIGTGITTRATLQNTARPVPNGPVYVNIPEEPGSESRINDQEYLNQLIITAAGYYRLSPPEDSIGNNLEMGSDGLVSGGSRKRRPKTKRRSKRY